jgi:hypothetical protein
MLHAREDGRAGTCQQTWGRIYVRLHVFIRADIWSKQRSPVPLKLVVFRSIPRIRLISVIVFQLLAVAIRAFELSQSIRLP